MKLSLQSTFFCHTSPTDLLSLSADCIAVGLDKTALYFQIAIKTNHAFPEHADRDVVIQIPSHNPKIMQKSDLFTRSEITIITAPFDTELAQGDQVCFIYNLCIKKIAADFSCPVNPSIPCLISLYVATKVINKNDFLLTDTLKLDEEINEKKQEFIRSFHKTERGEVHTGILQPPDNILCSTVSSKVSSAWRYGEIHLKVTASGVFF